MGNGFSFCPTDAAYFPTRVWWGHGDKILSMTATFSVIVKANSFESYLFLKSELDFLQKFGEAQGTLDAHSWM
jgi:hypothetical protein